MNGFWRTKQMASQHGSSRNTKNKTCMATSKLDWLNSEQRRITYEPPGKKKTVFLLSDAIDVRVSLRIHHTPNATLAGSPSARGTGKTKSWLYTWCLASGSPLPHLGSVWLVNSRPEISNRKCHNRQICRLIYFYMFLSFVNKSLQVIWIEAYKICFSIGLFRQISPQTYFYKCDQIYILYIPHINLNMGISKAHQVVLCINL